MHTVYINLWGYTLMNETLYREIELSDVTPKNAISTFKIYDVDTENERVAPKRIPNMLSSFVWMPRYIVGTSNDNPNIHIEFWIAAYYKKKTSKIRFCVCALFENSFITEKIKISYNTAKAESFNDSNTIKEIQRALISICESISINSTIPYYIASSQLSYEMYKTLYWKDNGGFTKTQVKSFLRDIDIYLEKERLKGDYFLSEITEDDVFLDKPKSSEIVFRFFRFVKDINGRERKEPVITLQRNGTDINLIDYCGSQSTEYMFMHFLSTLSFVKYADIQIIFEIPKICRDYAEEYGFRFNINFSDIEYITKTIQKTLYS